MMRGEPYLRMYLARHLGLAVIAGVVVVAVWVSVMAIGIWLNPALRWCDVIAGCEGGMASEHSAAQDATRAELVAVIAEIEAAQPPAGSLLARAGQVLRTVEQVYTATTCYSFWVQWCDAELRDRIEALEGAEGGG